MSTINTIPHLVIVGRPNVGKSSLFNRLFGRRRALVHDEPGVTRDRLEEQASWMVNGKDFPITLVDTGGLGGERFAEEIARQVDIALGEASIVLMLFDGQTGLTPADRDIAHQLKISGVEAKIPIIGIVNKVDADVHEEFIMDFYELGLPHLVTVSAEHARGIDDLQRLIVQILNEKGFGLAAVADETETEEPTDAASDTPRIPKIAIIGRPNVGKSTSLNVLVREERMITSPIAGTTVDAVDSLAELDGKPYLFIDTAGIRRKSKTEQGVEVLSVVQARKALERCDVALLVLDGEDGTTDQDEKIGSLIEDVGCGVILLVNKWDLQRQNQKFTKDVAADVVRKKMAFLRFAPVLFVSAKRQEGFDELPGLIDEVIEQRKVKIATKEFTEWVRKESEIHNPHGAKFYLCHQTGRNPPTFVCRVNDPLKIDFSLKRHLVNAMRERWGFMGSPVRLLFLKSQNVDKATSKAAVKHPTTK